MKKGRFIKRLTLIFFIIISIYVAITSVKWLGKIIYPLKYSDHIANYSKEYDVDKYLVASIILIESKYYKDAKSHKDARGLMQITPSTGEWIAKQIGIEKYNSDMLYDPKANIRMGCWYINNLKKQFNNNMDLVLAAYNGGSGNVSKWLKDERYSIDGLNLKDIPFEETKNYVKKVNKHYKIYKKLYDKGDF